MDSVRFGPTTFPTDYGLQMPELAKPVEVDRESGRFVLSGAGWGHGVGLCQIGAAVMANEGKTYMEILRHYYRGTTVGSMDSHRGEP
jgi:SpoIID/LytB domain protein